MKAPSLFLAILSMTFVAALFAQSSKPMMKAIVVHEYGGPEALKYEEVPRPEPKEDQILGSRSRGRRESCGRVHSLRQIREAFWDDVTFHSGLRHCWSCGENRSEYHEVQSGRPDICDDRSEGWRRILRVHGCDPG